MFYCTLVIVSSSSSIVCGFTKWLNFLLWKCQERRQKKKTVTLLSIQLFHFQIDNSIFVLLQKKKKKKNTTQKYPLTHLKSFSFSVIQSRNYKKISKKNNSRFQNY